MSDKKFKAWIVREENGKLIGEVSDKNISELPDGDVLINVKYSSLNYKDALSAKGNKGVTRKYPHVPGIDAAGIVEKSESPLFSSGEEVLVTGYDLGMNTSGGFAEYVRVPAEWVVKLPQGLSLKDSMMYGTAGLTAGLALYKLEKTGADKTSGDFLVTGATGGVGSIAAALLSRMGYRVIAATRKTDKQSFLKNLGAYNVINSEELNDKSGKALLQRKWKGAVDTVGGNILSTIIRAMDYRCSVAACGNTLSYDLNITVFPFILRGVNLLGINSAETPMALRVKIWQKLANEWKLNLNEIITECTLFELKEKIDLIYKGKITGRVLVDLNK